MDTFLQDLRHALRALGGSPGFAVVAVLTLALGIGVTTAIFSVVDTLLLRPLPYPDAARVVTIWQDNRREGSPREEVSPANFYEWRERSRSFSDIAGAEPYAYSLLASDGHPEAVFAVRVTEGFFDALGIRAYRGRLFTPSDHVPGAGNFAVIAHGFWQRRFGGDPAVVGTVLPLDGQPFVIVGVLPPDFELAVLRDVPGERNVWVARQEEGDARASRSRGGWWAVIARLRPDVTLDQARADMRRVADVLATEYPRTNADIGATLVPLRDHLAAGARPGLLLLLGAAALVLLVACANVACLLIARATERGHEFAVRSALGASRRRLVRQLLTESMALGVFGGAIGVVLALWGVDLAKTSAAAEIPRMDAVAVDGRVLGFALGMSLTTALLFGLAPASRSWGSRVVATLQGARATGDRRQRRVHAALIVGEVAVALTLLAGAGLLIRSLAAILAVDPGFRKEHVLALQVFAWDRNETVEERVRFYDETLRRIRAVPGVISAGAASAAPFLATDIAARVTFRKEEEAPPAPGEEPQAFVAHVTPGYFTSLAIPILRGRTVDETDLLGAPRVAVVNESTRRRYWPGEDPVGRRIRLGRQTDAIEIVGVVGDVLHRGLDTQPRPEISLPQSQTGFGGMTYFARTHGAPRLAEAAVKDAVWAVDPLQDFYHTAALENLVDQTLAGRRFGLTLLAGLALLTLLLAAVGIYGVLSFAVSRRQRELGIRMALGAARAQVFRLVLADGARLAAAGAAIGLVGALVTARFLAGFLYGVRPTDPITLAGVVLILCGVALLASYVPARRAARVDPIEALRIE